MLGEVNSKSRRFETAALREQIAPPDIIQSGNPMKLKSSSKIFKVVDANPAGDPPVALGDGVYHCYEQQIDGSEWLDVGGTPKNINKETTPVSVEVLNLHEADVAADYARALAPGDLLIASKWTDDTGVSRWCGVPAFAPVRNAKVTEAAPAATFIHANLYNYEGAEITTGLGSQLHIYCNICGGNNLNNASPLLANGDSIMVININGKWHCTTLFDSAQDCN